MKIRAFTSRAPADDVADIPKANNVGNAFKGFAADSGDFWEVPADVDNADDVGKAAVGSAGDVGLPRK